MAFAVKPNSKTAVTEVDSKDDDAGQVYYDKMLCNPLELVEEYTSRLTQAQILVLDKIEEVNEHGGKTICLICQSLHGVMNCEQFETYIKLCEECYPFETYENETAVRIGLVDTMIVGVDYSYKGYTTSPYTDIADDCVLVNCNFEDRHVKGMFKNCKKVNCKLYETNK